MVTNSVDVDKFWHEHEDITILYYIREDTTIPFIALASSPLLELILQHWRLIYDADIMKT